ncbi:hypothetical protein SAMN05444161_3784 [Rhizobiales bacterium GAS191]|jgi:hypothetical protein|nr:hypothetical protein SAMN05519103_02932 [Rhizobiales bacterium GAS113]SED70051.1 hypothetical protein SAMN05444161_3784 [Rhizobiales bacterium GAS191]SEE72608.1 hypothetical protein SAMN05519104_7228 [Rhizobiales bacterium GAS188]
MTGDLDLVKIDVDLIEMIVRLRSGSAPADAGVAEFREREGEEEGA